MASEPKFTKGPWAVSPTNPLIVVAGKGVALEAVAIVKSGSRLAAGRPEDDAHLIAAAPAMHEALEAIVANLQTADMDLRAIASVRIARAALSLARGEGK